MKIQLPGIKCHECNQENFPDVWLGNDKIEFDCKKCSAKNSGSHYFSIGRMILFKSFHELMEREDYILSMVLSAMAFECQLTHFYSKRIKIEGMEKYLQDNQNEHLVSGEKLEKMLRELSPIKKTMKKVGELLYPKGGIEAFIQLHNKDFLILDDSKSIFKKGKIIEGFEKILFWQRNAIPHKGELRKYKLEDAYNSYNAANFGLMLLEKMDQERRKQPL